MSWSKCGPGGSVGGPVECKVVVVSVGHVVLGHVVAGHPVGVDPPSVV